MVPIQYERLNMKQHDLIVLCSSRCYEEYKINYLNLFNAKLEDRVFEEYYPFYQDIASSLFECGIKKSYIDCRVKYDHNTEFDFLFACKVNSKEYLVNIELTKTNDIEKKIKQLKRHKKFLSQFYSQYNIITILVQKKDNCKNYFLLDNNDELQEFDFCQAKYEVEWDSNFELEETTVIDDFQCDWLTEEQYNKFKEIENLHPSKKYIWLKGNAGSGKTSIGLKIYREKQKTILLKCAEVSDEEQEKGIKNFTKFMNKEQKIIQHYDFLIVDECQSIVEKQRLYIEENSSHFNHIVFLGDDLQNYLQSPVWSKYLSKISSDKKHFKKITLTEYLRQNKDTINFFKYLCFDIEPNEVVEYPQFMISRYSFKNLPSLKHNWNKNKYNKEVAIGRAIGKTYKKAEVIIGKEFKKQETMKHLFTLLTRTPCPIIYFEDNDLYNWFINKYNNYINKIIH